MSGRSGSSHATMAQANHNAAPSMEHQMDIAGEERRQQESATAQFTTNPQDMGLIPFARDSFDQKAAALRAIATPASKEAQILGLAHGVQRTRAVSDAEIDYAERVQAQQEQVLYDQWVVSQFDLTNPAIVDKVRKMFPGFWERQKAFVDAQFTKMRRYTDVAMFGIQSEEDAKFLWLLNRGIIQMPAGYDSYQSLSGRLPGTAYEGAPVTRGMFNVLNFATVQDVQSQAKYGYDVYNQVYAMSPLSSAERTNKSTMIPESVPHFWKINGVAGPQFRQ